MHHPKSLADLLYDFESARQARQRQLAEMDAQLARLDRLTGEVREELSCLPAGVMVSAHGRAYRLSGSKLESFPLIYGHDVSIPSVPAYEFPVSGTAEEAEFGPRAEDGSILTLPGGDPLACDGDCAECLRGGDCGHRRPAEEKERLNVMA